MHGQLERRRKELDRNITLKEDLISKSTHTQSSMGVDAKHTKFLYLPQQALEERRSYIELKQNKPKKIISSTKSNWV